MHKNASILLKLVEEDFGVNTDKGSRWGKGEQHDSLVVDKERGIFYWNSRGIAGSPVTYLMEVRGLSFPQAKELLRDYTEYEDVFVYNVSTKRGDVVVYPKLVEVFYNDARADKTKRDYMYRRGIIDSTLDKFQVGWYNEYTTIPFFEGGVFRNFQMRKDIPDKRIKGYYSGIGPLLFNSDILKLVSEIYYVEGPVDSMILDQHGIPSISSNSGGAYLKEWYSKFLYQQDIYLVFDNDDAGRKEAKRLAKFLGQERCKIYCFEDFDEPGYDPVDFFRDGNTKEDFLSLVRNKSKYLYEI